MWILHIVYYMEGYNMIRISEEDMIFIPIITAIVNVFKALGIKAKFAPVLSIGVGIIFAVFFSAEIDIKFKVLKGILLGLSSSGIYSHGKGAVEVLNTKSNKFNKEEKNNFIKPKIKCICAKNSKKSEKSDNNKTE